ncbi:hypothetical protein F6R98_20295 [Candidatus Methylospira mobilis]|uniref:Uncharacterized protein n=1 Tax=Candidatus Methylospira mobilis TaxID=1808979 RepID=A0A5Q0BRI2_9GAMM|nr:hypothetical protein [Candidatus Methylospira mobilis]QFY44678.1 hypothetical protein F6R98_20295 [Candidatus Methylospira mobilis]WNV05787.1 hypothetical protein RP726_05035 [Candidatus Methylospira mobilis]
MFGFTYADTSPFVYPKIGYVCKAVFLEMALARQMRVLRRRIDNGLRLHLAKCGKFAGERPGHALGLYIAHGLCEQSGHRLTISGAAVRSLFGFRYSRAKRMNFENR